MRKRIAVLAVAALGTTAAFAAPAFADPTVSVCGSVQVTVNGSDVVDDATCFEAPPRSSR